MRGITGPLEVFEGNKGFMDTISGRFEIEWSRENLEHVSRTIIKRYNAEIHSQSAIEGIRELRQEYGFSAAEVAHIIIDIFDVAYHIIGGGEEGDKTLVRSKEEADHSLPYMIAVAVLDGRVMPDEYRLERIHRDDVQALLRKITIRPLDVYSQRFPEQMPCGDPQRPATSDFYTREPRYLESRVLEAGDVILLAGGGHGFEILEEIEMIEIKQGPYFGDEDKTRFATNGPGPLRLS